MQQLRTYISEENQEKMASTAKAAILLFLAALICHLHIGDAQGCELTDIHITLVKTGNVVEEQDEYEVTIDNTCSCPQSGVNVRCLGLPSVEPVDQSKIRAVDGELCLVADGGAIAQGSPVTFTYAWKTPQDFTVVSATLQC